MELEYQVFVPTDVRNTIPQALKHVNFIYLTPMIQLKMENYVLNYSSILIFHI